MLMQIPVSWLISLSLILFAIGMFGVVTRKNAIVLFMCIELMLNAVNLSFLAFSRLHGNLIGQVSIVFVMVVAAAEAAVGLAIILGLFRARKTMDTSQAGELKF